MARDATIEELDVLDGEAVEGVKRRRLSGKKIVLIGVLLLLLAAAALGALWGFGIIGASPDKAAAKPGAAAPAKLSDTPIFYDLPDILVTLNTDGRKASYLKLKVSLELHDLNGKERLDAVLPRIIDNFQVYLRELRVEDLEGSAGLLRLKEELLVRVNAAVRPVVVSDVLFKEMLVQ